MAVALAAGVLGRPQCRLTELDLSWNQLTGRGVEAITQQLGAVTLQPYRLLLALCMVPDLLYLGVLSTFLSRSGAPLRAADVGGRSFLMATAGRAPAPPLRLGAGGCSRPAAESACLSHGAAAGHRLGGRGKHGFLTTHTL